MSAAETSPAAGEDVPAWTSLPRLTDEQIAELVDAYAELARSRAARLDPERDQGEAESAFEHAFERWADLIGDIDDDELLLAEVMHQREEIARLRTENAELRQGVVDVVRGP